MTTRQPPHVAPAREIERREQRPATPAGEQQPQRLRTPTEHILRVDRHQRHVGNDRPRHHRDEAKQRPRRREVDDVAESLGKAVPPSAPQAPIGVGGKHDARERDEHRDERKRVEREADGLGGDGEEKAGERRPDDPRAIDEQRVQRDRIRQVLARLDHVNEERLAQRDVEGIRDPLPQGQQHEMPRLHDARGHDDRERDGLQRKQALRHVDRAPAIDAVGDDAGERAEEQDAGVAAERDDAEH